MKAFKWIMINSAYVFCLVDGTRNGVQWELNIFYFLFWLNVVLSILMPFFKDAKENIRKMGRNVPETASWALTLVICIYMASLGWFIHAGFGLLATASYQLCFEVENK